MNTDHCRQIPNFPGYLATRAGEIVSLRNGEPYTMTQFINRRYLAVKVRGEQGGVVRFVHSLTCAAFHGPRPGPDIQVRHLDGNRFNNNVDNLRWGTCTENRQDALKHGTAHLLKPGEANVTHRLTETQVREMIQRRAAGEKYKDIAEAYSITIPHCWNIVNGKRWRHLKEAA